MSASCLRRPPQRRMRVHRRVLLGDRDDAEHVNARDAPQVDERHGSLRLVAESRECGRERRGAASEPCRSRVCLEFTGTRERSRDNSTGVAPPPRAAIQAAASGVTSRRGACWLGFVLGPGGRRFKSCRPDREQPANTRLLLETANQFPRLGSGRCSPPSAENNVDQQRGTGRYAPETPSAHRRPRRLRARQLLRAGGRRAEAA